MEKPKAKGQHGTADTDQDTDEKLFQKIRKYTSEAEETMTPEKNKYTGLINKLLDFENAYGPLDFPVSLDQYFHGSSDSVEMNLRNGDQSISRFIARQRAQRECASVEAQPTGRRSGQSTMRRGHAGTTGEIIDQTAFPGSNIADRPSPGQLEAGTGNTEQPGPSETKDSQRERQRILTVSKFWIWKLDGTLARSFSIFNNLHTLPNKVYIIVYELDTDIVRRHRCYVVP